MSPACLKQESVLAALGSYLSPVAPMEYSKRHVLGYTAIPQLAACDCDLRYSKLLSSIKPELTHQVLLLLLLLDVAQYSQ